LLPPSILALPSKNDPNMQLQTETQYNLREKIDWQNPMMIVGWSGRLAGRP